jgi:hypothetical protein
VKLRRWQRFGCGLLGGDDRSWEGMAGELERLALLAWLWFWPWAKQRKGEQGQRDRAQLANAPVDIPG